MAPRCWTTPEQAQFLESWLPQYQAHVNGKDYARFWPTLYAEWFIKWPEASSPGEDGLAIQKRQRQLQTWFRWRTNGSRQGRLQKKLTSAFDKAIDPKGMRLLSRSEIYYMTHYDDRIKPKLKVEQDAGKLNTSGKFLAAGRKLAKQLLELEGDEVKGQIEEIYRQQKKESLNDEGNSDEPTDPAEIQRVIEDLPFALARCAQLIKARTRFAMSFLCAGPDPSRNWEITSLSCHPDETPHGNTFAMMFPKEENTVLATFQDYAEALFPPEMRDPTRVPEDTGEPNGAEGSMDVENENDGEPVIEKQVDEHEGMVEDENEDIWTDVDDNGNGNQELSSAGNGDEWDGPVPSGMGIGLDIMKDASQPSADIVASSDDVNIYPLVDIAGTMPVPTDNVASAFNASTLLDHPSLASMIGLQNPSYDFNFSLPNGTPMNVPTAILSTVPAMRNYVGPHSFSQNGSNPNGAPMELPLPTVGNYIGPHFSFSQNGPNSSPFSDAASAVNTDLAAHSWNFDGVGFNSLGTQAPRFGGSSADLPLLPLPPTISQDSPARSHLPAIPPPPPPTPPSSPTDNSGGALAESTKNAKGRPKPKIRCKASSLPTAPLDGATTIPNASGSNNRGTPSTATSLKDNVTPQAPPPILTVIVTQQASDPRAGAASPVQRPKQGHVAPLTPRASKRVPIQSKRNAMADAIGSNQQSFVGAGDDQGALSTTQKAKRAGVATGGAKAKWIHVSG